jgi:hypothetical protein
MNIKLFQQNAEGTAISIKQQLYVVKILFRSNNTLTEVEYNEQLLQERIRDVNGYTDTSIPGTRVTTQSVQNPKSKFMF